MKPTYFCGRFAGRARAPRCPHSTQATAAQAVWRTGPTSQYIYAAPSYEYGPIVRFTVRIYLTSEAFCALRRPGRGAVP